MIYVFVIIALSTGAFASWYFLANKKRLQIINQPPIKRLRVVLIGLAAALLAVSVLPIGRPSQLSNNVLRNLDVYIMVDTSLSMRASDYENGGTRLDGIHQDVASKISELAGSRFTVISFHGTATVELPGMYDTKAVQTTLQTIDTPLYYDARGTAFVPALKLVQERIQRAQKQEKTSQMRRVLILISDGERVGENEDANGALSDISKNIDSALVIGVGTAKGATMRVVETNSDGPNYDQPKVVDVLDTGTPPENDTRPRGADGLPLAVSKADFDRLKDFSKHLNGQFIELHSSTDVKSALKKLDAGSTFSVSDRKQFTRSAPNSYYWLTALASLALIWLVQLHILRTWRKKRSTHE